MNSHSFVIIYPAPEAPSSPQVVENIVFLWQPPSKPNGNITGYQVCITYISSTGSSIEVPPTELDPVTFHYVLRKGVVPENVTASIKVSATRVKKSFANACMPMYSQH